MKPSTLGIKVRLVKQSPLASVPLFFWLTVLVTTNVYAQISDSPGSVNCPPAVDLTVTVTTEDGAAVIPNALVILREDTLGQPRSVTVFEELRTGQNGKVTTAVPCNYLDIFVGRDGFAPAAQKFLITKDAHTFSVPLKMYPITRTTEVPHQEPSSEMPPLPSTIPESAQGPAATHDSDRIAVTVKSSSVKDKSVMVEARHGSKNFEVECTLTDSALTDTPCTALEAGKYRMVRLGPGKGIYMDCPNADVYRETPNGKNERKLGEYCLLQDPD